MGNTMRRKPRPTNSLAFAAAIIIIVTVICRVLTAPVGF